MKLNLDPMPGLRAAAVVQINAHFNRMSVENHHRDSAHTEKRLQAAAVLAGGAAGAEFAAEATLRGLTPLEMATGIASKPNTAAGRELARQTLLLRVEAVTTPAALTSLLTFRF